MKKIYSKLSIIILTCVVIVALCSCDLFTTDEDKFILEEINGDKDLVDIDIEKTGANIVVPEKVGDDVIHRIYLSGVYFPGIESLDVSNVTELEFFTLKPCGSGSESKLKRLDFSKNEKLRFVNVINTKVLEEVFFNENCESIHIKNTAIKEIDLKGLKKLAFFDYCNGPLEELDVSNNPALEQIHVINTNVKVIDVSNNPNLEHIWVNEGVQIIGNTNARIDYVDEELAKRIKED